VSNNLRYIKKTKLLFHSVTVQNISVVLKKEHKIVEKDVDTIQERSNSNFDVKRASIQFYSNSRNSQSDS
jgi:hypothetical protein